ncbi:hypothetical protein CP532_1476 [Ophiocordyceps camponoti-leonardi (nom. inval.)]|nr:hypothetical protein CP532_1476 [Ophiocordyceps camponoti-leonardi (nom. inval.)]
MALLKPSTYVTGGIRARRALARAPLVIPRSIFARIAREILAELQRSDLRFEVLAIHALQDAAEKMIIDMFKAMRLIARNGRREVVRPQDLIVLLETLNIFKLSFSKPFSPDLPRLPPSQHFG